jgi:hypothetical protein
MRVAGLQYYKAEQARASGLLQTGVSVSLVHEPENPRDPDAYAVVCGGYKLGHVPAFAAKLLRAANAPAALTGQVVAVMGQGNDLGVDIAIQTGIEAAPEKYALSSSQRDDRGVYAIVNVFDMRAYIGQSTRLDTRRREHLQDLQARNHSSPGLQADWLSFPQRFAFVVVDADPNDLVQKERQRVYLYATHHPACGYNQGDGFAPGQPMTARQSRVNRNPGVSGRQTGRDKYRSGRYQTSMRGSSRPGSFRYPQPGSSQAGMHSGQSGPSGSAGRSGQATPNQPREVRKPSGPSQPPGCSGCVGVLLLLGLTLVWAVSVVAGTLRP